MCNAWNHSLGCNCGWGGEGHAGSSTGGHWVATSEPSGSVQTYGRSFSDVCHSTSCPECRQEVFFIRHNGGCVWVDPPLGWLWDKHDCFYRSRDDVSHSAVSSLAQLSENLPNASLGLVNRLSRLQSSVGPRLQVGCLDGTLIAARGRAGFPYEMLLGELVVISREKGILRHSRLGDFPITILPDSEIEDGPAYVWHRDTELKTKCPLCTGYFYESEREDHLLRKCPRRPPLIRPRQRSKPDHKPFLVLRAPTGWAKCPKCPASVPIENLESHIASCRGPSLKTSPEIERTVLAIAQRVKAATRHIREASKARKTAMRLANDEISRLEPNLRRKVRAQFEQSSWRQIIR